MSKKHLLEIEDAGAFICARKLMVPLEFKTASDAVIHSTQECHLNLELHTSAGIINIKNAQVYIISEEIPEILFGKPLLNLLGINIEGIVEDIAKEHKGCSLCRFFHGEHVHEI